MKPISTTGHSAIGKPLEQVRRTLVAAAVAGALAVLAPPPGVAQDASSEDVKELRRQLQQMQREIDSLKAQQAQSPSATQPAPAPAQATPAQPQSPPPLVSSPKDSAQGATAPSASFMAGPVKITPGGFVELMVVNRDRNESADWASNFNTSIPYPNSHNYYLSEFHLTERQSRLQSLFQGPESETWSPEAYVEADFGGAGGTANNNESSSFSPRVRHFFADLTYKPYGANLLFGQTWSLVTGFKTGLTVRQENIPLTIDGQYVPGFDWLRLPQIRFTERFNDLLSAGLSLENPSALVSAGASSGAPSLPVMYSNAGATNSFSSTNGTGTCTTTAPGTTTGTTATCTVSAAAINSVSVDYLPDIVAKAALDPGFGHFEAFVTERFFRDRVLTAGKQTNEKTNATGFGGSLILPVVPKIIDFQASILAGRGIGRYGSAQLPDATINANSLEVEPLHAFQALAGLIARPSSYWTVFAYAGEEQVSKGDTFTSAAGKIYGYGYGNSLFSNANCEVEGGSACAANTARIVSGTFGGWWKFYQGWLGNAQLGLTDTYIKREIFSGIGGDPNTNINITLVSFRYYPFQR